MPSPLMSPTVRPRPNLAFAASINEKPVLVPSKSVEPSTDADHVLVPKKNAYSAAVAAAFRNDGDVVNAIVVDVESAQDLRRATSEGTICEFAIG